MRVALLLLLASKATGLTVPQGLAATQLRPAVAHVNFQTSQLSAHAAFEAAVQLCEERAAAPAGAAALSADVPWLLRRCFDADFENIIRDGTKLVTNVTCMMPLDVAAGSRCFDNDLVQLPLRPGRVCDGGCCSGACSRVILPDFLSRDEAYSFRDQLDNVMVPIEEHPHHNLYLMSCAAAGNVRTTLSFVRIVEKLRRMIAHEYGLDLSSLAPKQTFVSRLSCESADASSQPVHCDESSHGCFHYSTVLYLSTQGEEFDGGSFAFTDPSDDDDGIHSRSGERRVMSGLSPQSGLAVAFSSGWENLHYVEPITSGVRYAMPTFFSTVAREEMVRRPVAVDDDAVIAEELWRCCLMPESEDDFRRLLREWHWLLA